MPRVSSTSSSARQGAPRLSAVSRRVPAKAVVKAKPAKAGRKPATAVKVTKPAAKAPTKPAAKAVAKRPPLALVPRAALPVAGSLAALRCWSRWA